MVSCYPERQERIPNFSSPELDVFLKRILGLASGSQTTPDLRRTREGQPQCPRPRVYGSTPASHVGGHGPSQSGLLGHRALSGKYRFCLQSQASEFLIRFWIRFWMHSYPGLFPKLRTCFQNPDMPQMGAGPGNQHSRTSCM